MIISAPPTQVVFAIFKRASDQRLVIKRYTPAVYVAAAVVGARRLAAPGAAAAASPFQLPVWEWPLPVIDDAGNSTDVSGSATTMIAATSTPMQPGGPSSALPADSAGNNDFAKDRENILAFTCVFFSNLNYLSALASWHHTVAC